ncbi:nitrogen fixation protein NifZ [Rhodopseudomonas sp. P2A-2r]|uniref:nitrogen fixation protein NifZ n=1 Tax=unclassified Rhodopseudomonas TaxID=2638247 RepID=UPI00223424F7|nr:nitrogen fixation protein NifZ [Rhodopseudomonas sp. P2A-2r]UZE50287.1 nitrogen fixation protein NifZ [Rhodopseudomonas sp. P2A-2r]
MNHPNPRLRPTAIARVVHDPRRRSFKCGTSIAGQREFKAGEAVRSLTRVINDGIYPHRDIGEILVNGGDVGVVRESWSFLGETYYTVEFFANAAVVIMRGEEMAKAALRGGRRPAH